MFGFGKSKEAPTDDSSNEETVSGSEQLDGVEAENVLTPDFKQEDENQGPDKKRLYENLLKMDTTVTIAYRDQDGVEQKHTGEIHAITDDFVTLTDVENHLTLGREIEYDSILDVTPQDSSEEEEPREEQVAA